MKINHDIINFAKLYDSELNILYFMLVVGLGHRT